MAEMHYGVVEQDGRWVIIGAGLRYGAYEDRASAEQAARQLAASSSVRVNLHVQDETGQLLPPEGLG
jgi:hypothetical protein